MQQEDSGFRNLCLQQSVNSYCCLPQVLDPRPWSLGLPSCLTISRVLFWCLSIEDFRRGHEHGNTTRNTGNRVPNDWETQTSRAPDARIFAAAQCRPSIMAGRSRSSSKVAVNARKKVSRPKAWRPDGTVVELWSLAVTRVVVWWTQLHSSWNLDARFHKHSQLKTRRLKHLTHQEGAGTRAYSAGNRQHASVDVRHLPLTLEQADCHRLHGPKAQRYTSYSQQPGSLWTQS